ncbi:glutamine amidotransferase-related protein [Haliangium sp.]|uniref:glutamine amidotransferase-related protein n=1 Tax=Haliangium sp. TaxID=2663208 RepID=UPI003D1024E5
MKIGILVTGAVDDDLCEEFGPYSDMFIDWLGRRPGVTYTCFDTTFGELPARPHDHDAYLITGSPSGVHDPELWIPRLSDFVRAAHDAGCKLVGICFGHQLLAHALGGRVTRSPRGWGAGTAESRVLQTKPWMQPMKPSIRLLVTHQDQVVALPPGAEVLLGNEFCPFDVVQYSAHALSMQGHPEHPRAYTSALVERRRSSYPPGVYERARETLTLPTDETIVASWVWSFLGADEPR